MIPIRDHNPSGKFPFVTYSLIAINVVVFAYMVWLGAAADGFVEHYALVPNEIIHGHHVTTLLTSMFLHGGFAHILGNMLFLNIFGDNLEDRYGHIGFLFFYLGAGLAASALQIAVDPTSTVPNLGASGAIAGTMGGYLFLYPNNRIDVLWGFYGSSSVPARMMLIYWIVFQFLYGAGSIGGISDGVAYFAHIGGFAFGYLVTRFFTRPPQAGIRQLSTPNA